MSQENECLVVVEVYIKLSVQEVYLLFHQPHSIFRATGSGLASATLLFHQLHSIFRVRGSSLASATLTLSELIHHQCNTTIATRVSFVFPTLAT